MNFCNVGKKFDFSTCGNSESQKCNKKGGSSAEVDKENEVLIFNFILKFSFNYLRVGFFFFFAFFFPAYFLQCQSQVPTFSRAAYIVLKSVVLFQTHGLEQQFLDHCPLLVVMAHFISLSFYSLLICLQNFVPHI